MNSKLDPKILHALGLDTVKITRHHKKIHQVLRKELTTDIKVVDVCSVSNGSVLSWNTLRNLIQNISKYILFQSDTKEKCFEWIQKYIITCIPAAGAASRYWKGAPRDYLPSYHEFPKALFPVTLGGDTFLEIKLMEQDKLFPTSGNVFISPFGFKEKFEEAIILSRGGDSTGCIHSKWHILEQDKSLSTIRFNRDGTPYLLNAEYSSVPAGHGELLFLFDDIMEKFPNSYGLHLRNLDNIIGTQPEQIYELSLLAQTFYFIRSALEVVRIQVKKFIENPDLALSEQDLCYQSALNFLQDCAHSLIPKMECDSAQDWEEVLLLLNKPLAVLGMVKKESDDQGGGPVFARLPNGHVIKVCLEMSHVNETEREEYFGKNGKLLYFNPVLVFLETQAAFGRTHFKSLFDEDFWILSERYYQDSPVCYHETALYELIGNSEKTNLVFVEVPRTLFKPHKYFLDSVNRTRKSYGL